MDGLLYILKKIKLFINLQSTIFSKSQVPTASSQTHCGILTIAVLPNQMQSLILKCKTDSPQYSNYFAVFSHYSFSCLLSHKAINLNRLSSSYWLVWLQCVEHTLWKNICGLYLKILLHMLLLINCLVPKQYSGNIRQVTKVFCTHSALLVYFIISSSFQFQIQSLSWNVWFLQTLCFKLNLTKFFAPQKCRMKICHALNVQKLFPFAF